MRNSIRLYKTNDLKLMATAGFLFTAFNFFIYPMDVYQQLFFCFAFSSIAGLLIIDRSQLMEWPLFFVFGGILGSLICPMIPFEFVITSTGPEMINIAKELLPLVVDTLYWFMFLTATWVLGLPIGMGVHRLFLGKDYWLQKTVLS